MPHLSPTRSRPCGLRRPYWKRKLRRTPARWRRTKATQSSWFSALTSETSSPSPRALLFLFSGRRRASPGRRLLLRGFWSLCPSRFFRRPLQLRVFFVHRFNPFLEVVVRLLQVLDVSLDF